MKTKLTTLALVLLCYPVFGQAQMVDITTPNGSPLWVFIDPDPRSDYGKAS